MRLTCRAVRLQLPLVDESQALAEPLASHVATCLRCQAESARYRSLHRSLAGLGDQTVAAPEGFVAEVSALMHDPGFVVVPSQTRTARVVAAAGAVVAAAGTVAMVRWLRTRAVA